jgi:hypothetical protein
MDNRLQPVPLGIAVGVLSAAYIFLAAIFAMFGWGVPVVDLIASFYIGYGPTILGAIIGAIWALVDGFVFGALIAWIYNMVAQ